MSVITSAEEFIRLRSSSDPKEYHLAAWGEATDEVWMDVIKKYPDYTRWVAHNKSISLNVVRLLANHPDADVRHFIASKRKTPPDVLWILARDENESVRKRIVYNAKTPQVILVFLLNDSSDEIQEVAKKRLAKVNIE